MPNTDGTAKSSYSRTLSESECYELLAVATIGRIGFVSPAGVQILPVDYRLGAGHRLFMRTSPQGTVAQLAEKPLPSPSRSIITPVTSGAPGVC